MTTFRLLSRSLLFSGLLLAASCSGSSGSSTPPTGPGPGAVVTDVLQYPFLGTKRLLFIVVGFQDVPPLFESSAAGEGELITVGETVQEACRRNSYDNLQIEFDYTWPPLQIPKKTTDYDPSDALVRVRADAIEAARLAGYAPEQYDREVLFSPVVWGSAARGWVRTIWMPHKLPFVLYHEIGHTMGWGHANFWNGDPLGPGDDENYGDLYDPMGTGQMWLEYHYSSPWFKGRAGWLTPQDVTDVTTSGTYTLRDLEDPDTTRGPVALHIRRDANDDYWIFHRLKEPDVQDGVVIVRTRGNPFEGSLLLDMHRGTPAGQDEAVDAELRSGETFDDSVYAGIVVSNVTAGGAVTLDVQVDEARELGLDVPPVIGVTRPGREQEPISGQYEFEVTTADPSVADPAIGPRDGEGIAKVRLEILEPSGDPFVVVASVELSQRPYRWTFDTTTLRDAPHYLAVTAEALDGGSRTIWYRFLIDNASASGS